MLQAAVIIILLILLTALYVAAEFAAVGARRSRLRRLAEDGNALAARILPVLESPHELDRYIAASQVGITLSSLILGAYGQSRLAPRIAPLFEQVARAGPGDRAIHRRGRRAARADRARDDPRRARAEVARAPGPDPHGARDRAADAVVAARSSRPSIAFLNGSGVLLLKLLGVASTGHRHVHSPEEIELLIAESRDGGLLEPLEQVRLHRALRLGLRTARQLMVPRARLAAVDAATPFDEVLQARRHQPVQPAAGLSRLARSRHRHPPHQGCRARLHRRSAAGVDRRPAAADPPRPRDHARRSAARVPARAAQPPRARRGRRRADLRTDHARGRRRRAARRRLRRVQGRAAARDPADRRPGAAAGRDAARSGRAACSAPGAAATRPSRRTSPQRSGACRSRASGSTVDGVEVEIEVVEAGNIASVIVGTPDPLPERAGMMAFLIIAALILLNGLFVAAEFAIVGAPRAAIDARAAAATGWRAPCSRSCAIRRSRIATSRRRSSASPWRASGSACTVSTCWPTASTR